jgi:signal transduction histidine kinase
VLRRLTAVDDPWSPLGAHRGCLAQLVRGSPLPVGPLVAHAGDMTTLGAPVRAPARAVRVVGVVAVLGALVFGFWARAPWLDDVTGVTLDVAVGVALVATGVLLRAEPVQRSNGAMFVAIGLLWLANGLNARDYGPFPVLGWLATPFDELLLMVILLRYPASRIRDGLARRVVAGSAAAVTVLHLASGLLWDPAAHGWGHGFWWVTFVAIPDAAQSVIWYGYAAAGLVAAVLTVVLTIRRFLRSRGMDRRDLVPVLVAAAGVGLSYVVLQAAMLATGSDQPGELLSRASNAAMLTIPAAFIVASLRRRLDRAAVADLLLTMPQPATVTSVRDTLREALMDQRLELFVWLPERQAYTDGAGVVSLPAHDERLWRELLDTSGSPLAVVLADATLARRADLVDTAIRAATLSLENARLHAELLVRLQELRDSRTRIVEAGVTQRRQVERDLHDGAQQRLLALASTIGRARAATTDPHTREILEQARLELRQALKDLRDLARGIHPAVLEQVGLSAAVESVAEALPLPVQVDVDAGQLPPAVESTAYFVICEALVNVVKHADAARATVAVHRRTGTVHLTVDDDGAGGATITANGGLAGLTDRVSALGGRLAVHSPTDAGTRLTVELPCES